MNLELFNTEANNIWKKAAGGPTPEQLHFELDLYKKLLSFFQVGDFYYMIFNIPILDLEFTSKEIETVLGYHPSEFNMHKLLDIIHQDDRPYFLNFENKAAQFLAMLPIEKLMKYKVRYDYRIQKKNGAYIRVLQQSTAIEHDENGGLIRTLGVHTDITHLKSEGKPVLSFIGLDGEPSYINIDVEKVFAVSKEFLSKREKQVLSLLIEGKLSKDIGHILHISKQTVDKHRKNMLHKNNLSNTSELIGKAVRHGWI
jgi:DNA-binding CsgD family transcriptional regulator